MIKVSSFNKKVAHDVIVQQWRVEDVQSHWNGIEEKKAAQYADRQCTVTLEHHKICCARSPR